MHTTASPRRDSLDLLLRGAQRGLAGMRALAGGAGGAALTAPIWFGLGAAAGLSLSAPPDWSILYAATGLALLVSLGLRRRPHAALALLAFAAALGGMGRAGQTLEAATPPEAVLALEGEAVVTGWVEAVERAASGRSRIRLVLDEAPGGFRVRMLGDPGVFRPGDRVTVRARLQPLPGPAAPGGYDPARRAWFDHLVFTGFALEPLSAAIEPGREDPARRLARLRGELSERIRAEAGAPTGGLIAALLTGDRSGVTESQTEALRASGLGHLLAISGLHMGLFAGGVFFAVRFLFAALFRFSRARDPAVPAAVAALCAAAVYLALSGFAVSTQRAFVMSALVLAAVLARRRAISLRGLSLAALAVLALEPQSVAEPGFRMSFGAAGALVVVYALWRRLRPAPREASSRSNLARAGAWFAGLATTSLVAGLATAGFSAMHFNRLAGWGLLANLAAMPVFTLWVMPLAALGLALTPIGLEAPLLRLAGQGMELVVAISELAAAAPGAYVAVAAPPSWAATVYTTGFALLILGSALQRAAGLLLLVAALVFWGLARPAEVYVAQNGVAVIRTDQGWTSTRPDRPGYGAEMFLRRAGAAHWGAAPLSCDEASCTTRSRSGWLIAFPETPAALAEDCRRADVIIARFPAPGALRRSCQAYLLDETERARRGGVTLEPAPDGAFLRRGALDDTRLWRASDTSG